MNITQKQLAIVSELKAPKNKYNSFGKYNYRSCEDILEAVKPLLAKYGAALTIEDEIRQIGERFYVEATATLMDTEKGEKVASHAFAREDLDKKGMDGAQITGTASSYARKYALNGLFCIDDTKDADTDEYQKQTKPEKSFTGNIFMEDKKSAKAEEKIARTEEKIAKANQGALICENCKNPIVPTPARDGSTISAEQVGKISLEKFGVSLCAECMKKKSNLARAQRMIKENNLDHKEENKNA